MRLRPALIIALASISVAEARDWHSSDGARTISGDFVKISSDQLWLRTAQGQPIQVKLALLAADDQAYAKSAQTAVSEGNKLGATTFEVTQTTPVGCLCRMAVKLSNGSSMFTGEQFLLVGESKELPKKGTRLNAQTLFFAGQITFYPQVGSAMPLRSFALTLDPAAKAMTEVLTGKRTPVVYESRIEINEKRVLGYAISLAGPSEAMFLVESAALNGATSIDVDLGTDHSPATVVTSDELLGISVIACKGSFEPSRLAPKKPIALGQPIYAVSYPLNSSKRGLGDTTITKGIISKYNGREARFEHDASVDPNAVGGVILSEKGDVIGIMVSKPEAATKPLSLRTADSNASTSLTPTNLSLCISTQELIPFINSVPRIPVQRSTLNFDLQDTSETLKRSTVIVRITREIIHEVSPPPVLPLGTAMPPAGTPGWSISKAGIRHNAQCKYFNGRYPCQATEGTACKVCGG